MVWGSASSSKRDHHHNAPEDTDAARIKPLKRRGLSKFYSSKSQSFSCLELALSSPGLGRRPSNCSMLHDSSPDDSCCSPPVASSPRHSMEDSSCGISRLASFGEPFGAGWSTGVDEDLCTEFLAALHVGQRPAVVPSPQFSLASESAPTQQRTDSLHHNLQACSRLSKLSKAGHAQKALGHEQDSSVQPMMVVTEQGLTYQV